MAELVAQLGELRVPHVEGDLRLHVEAPCGLLQQRVALLQHTIQLEAHRVVLQGQRHQGVVHEATPFARTTLHQLEVVGRKHGDAHHPQQIAATTQALLVHLHSVAPRAVQFQLHQHLTFVGLANGGAHHGRVGAHTDECVAGRTAKAVERREIGHRLGQVRLALAVESDDSGDARMKVEDRRLIVAEVDQFDAGDDHSRSPTASARQKASA